MKKKWTHSSSMAWLLLKMDWQSNWNIFLCNEMFWWKTTWHFLGPEIPNQLKKFGQNKIQYSMKIVDRKFIYIFFFKLPHQQMWLQFTHFKWSGFQWIVKVLCYSLQKPTSIVEKKRAWFFLVKKIGRKIFIRKKILQSK